MNSSIISFLLNNNITYLGWKMFKTIKTGLKNLLDCTLKGTTFLDLHFFT